MVNFSCSGYPPSPVIWLSESWGWIGQAIDRTETESSAVLLCRAGHTVRQFNRCRAQGQPPLSALPKHTFAPLLPFWPCTVHVSLYDNFRWKWCRFIQLLTTNWFNIAALLTLAIGNGYENIPRGLKPEASLGSGSDLENISLQTIITNHSMIYLCLSVMITFKIFSLSTKNAHIYDIVITVCHSSPQLYSNSLILHLRFLSFSFSYIFKNK